MGAGVVSGTVEISSAGAVRRAVGSGVDVFLVRDGRVMRLPVARDAVGIGVDLGSGKVERLPGTATLVSCEPGRGSVGRGT